MRINLQTAFVIGNFCAVLMLDPRPARAGNVADADAPRKTPEAKAVEKPGEGKYREPLLRPPAFDLEALGMIEAERREYARNLAAFALSIVAAKHADAEGNLRGVPQAKYDQARKLVGLAIHLDPKSRAVVVANGRLKAGVIPQPGPAPGMAAGSFASLLVGRSVELMKTGGEANVRLAGCFLDAAMVLDPASDDVVFAFENFTTEGRKPDWRLILGGE